MEEKFGTLFVDVIVGGVVFGNKEVLRTAGMKLLKDGSSKSPAIVNIASGDVWLGLWDTGAAQKFQK